MKKILSLFSLAVLANTAFADNIQKAPNTSLADTVANTKTMQDLKESHLVCQSLGELMQCISQSNARAEQEFASIGIKTTDDNNPTITYLFETSTDSDDFCNYNMPDSKLKKCNPNAKFKSLFLSAEDLTKSDLKSANSAIKKAYKERDSENASQNGKSFEHTEYDATNGVKVETVVSYESYADNNINLVINYIQ